MHYNLYNTFQLRLKITSMKLLICGFRSTENKMDSSNLAVIFAPNLLHSSDADKLSAHTDRKLRLQAAVVQTLIDHAEEIGRVTTFVNVI